MKKFLFVLIGLLITRSCLLSQPPQPPKLSAGIYLYVPQQYPTITSALNYLTGNADTILVESGTTIIYEPGDVTIPSGVMLDFKNARVSFPGNLIAEDRLRSENSYIYLNNGIITTFGDVDCYRTSFIGNTSFVNSIDIVYNYGNRHIADCTINTSYGMQVYHAAFSSVLLKFTQDIIGINVMDYGIANIFDSVFEDNYYQDITVATTATAVKVTRSVFRGSNTTQIWNSSSNKIDATFNYWENGPRIINHGSGSVDTVPTVGPNAYPWLNQGDNRGVEIESGISLKKSVTKNDNDKPVEKVHGIEDLDKAIRLFFDEKYDEALAEMYKLVDKYNDGVVGKRALVFIEVILKKTDRANEILPILEEYSNGSSKVAEFAHYKKGHLYIGQGEYDRAIALIKAIEFSEEDTDLRQSRLYDLGLIHYILDKKAEAYNYFTELVTTYPDCQLSEVANIFYLSKKNKYEKPAQDEEIVTTTKTKLFTNYPNPFNPSTVIKYQLSDASQVSLKVYDVMGREVATLVNSYQNKGSYDVTFYAHELSSGIYFYKLNAGGKQLINKMLLMK